MTVDEYLDGAPEPQKSTLIELRQTLREILPAAAEVMSYGVPAFKVEGKAVSGYAYFKNHAAFSRTPVPFSPSLPTSRSPMNGRWGR